MQIYLNKNSVESLPIYNSENLLKNCPSFLCHTCHNTCAIQSTGQTLKGNPNWCSFSVLHRPILGSSSEMIGLKIICLRESQETCLFLAPTGIRKHFRWIIKPICLWNLCLSHVLNKVCIFLLYLHVHWNRIFRCPQDSQGGDNALSEASSLFCSALTFGVVWLCEFSHDIYYYWICSYMSS